jgi:hypothetical protein
VTGTQAGTPVVDQNSPFNFNLSLNTHFQFNLFTRVYLIPPTNGGATTAVITTTFNFTAPTVGTGVIISGETANRSGGSSNYTDFIDGNVSSNPNGNFSDDSLLQITLADAAVGPTGGKTTQTTATFALIADPRAMSVREQLTLSLFGAGIAGAAVRRRKSKKAAV